MPQLIQTKSCCFILFLSVGSAICNFYIYQSYVLEMEKEKKNLKQKMLKRQLINDLRASAKIFFFF